MSFPLCCFAKSIELQALVDVRTSTVEETGCFVPMSYGAEMHTDVGAELGLFDLVTAWDLM